MYEEGLREFDIAKVQNMAWKAITYGKMGKIHEAKRLLNNLKKQSEQSYVPHAKLFIAFIHFVLEEIDEGFRWLEKAYEERDTSLTQLKVNPIFDNVRSDARYKNLLKKMGLE
jgi:hypothetical protein